MPKCSAAHRDGVVEFMHFVGTEFRKDELITCPCRRCLNLHDLSQIEVNIHLLYSGMSATYTKWLLHGETEDVDVVQDAQGLGMHLDDADYAITKLS